MRRTLIALALLAAATPRPLATQTPARPFLFKDARGELAAAQARGEADVLVVIASAQGANGAVAGLIGSEVRP